MINIEKHLFNGLNKSRKIINLANQFKFGRKNWSNLIKLRLKE